MEKLRSVFRSQYEALRGDNSLSQDQKKEKMKALMEQQHAQMKNILTKEQLEKMESFRKDRTPKNTK
jgi:hypothetical protein